jgi:hypothetical protein
MVRSRSTAAHLSNVPICFSTRPSNDTTPLVTTRIGLIEVELLG